MPIFELQGPDGGSYEVDAPDEASALATFKKAPTAQAGGGAFPAQDKSYKGAILPFSVDAGGKAHFDPHAGVLGSIIDAVTFPRDWMEGKVDPNSDEAIARGLNLAMMASPVNPAVKAGDAAIPGPIRAVKPAEVAPPTAEALQTTAKAQYDKVRDSGVDYAGDAIGKLANSVKQSLQKDGTLDVNAPQTHSIIAQLSDPPTGSVVEIQHLESARRALGKIAQASPDPTERGAANQAVSAISDFIQKADPQSVVAGPASDAAKLMSDARGNYSAFKRSDLLTGKEYAADLRASAANSGQNIGNSIRQRLADSLIREKDLRGFSPEEVSAVEGIVKGSRGANTSRYLSNLLGGGGGLGMGATSGMGAAVGGAIAGVPGAAVGGAIPPIAGMSLKKLSNELTRSSLHHVDDMVRSRSPLFEEMKSAAPMTPISPERRAALVRALWMSQQSSGQ